MNPKEAQEQTEKRWLAIIAEPLDNPPLCGWCMFAAKMATKNVSLCHNCPVVHVFGESCSNIKEYEEWTHAEEEDADLARMVYNLVVTNRDALIQAGEEILHEQARRYDESKKSTGTN